MSTTSANSTVYFWKALSSETRGGLELIETFFNRNFITRNGRSGVISKNRLLNSNQTESFPFNPSKP